MPKPTNFSLFFCKRDERLSLRSSSFFSKPLYTPLKNRPHYLSYSWTALPLFNHFLNFNPGKEWSFLTHWITGSNLNNHNFVTAASHLRSLDFVILILLRAFLHDLLMFYHIVSLHLNALVFQGLNQVLTMLKFLSSLLCSLPS